MRMKIYSFLVNRHDGIRIRYHRLHDGADRKGKILSYVYLLWLNFCYYILFCRFLKKAETVQMYERKRLFTKHPESASLSGETGNAERFAEELSQYDVISFDLFDTLIFRPFSEPGDLFYFLGTALGVMDFKRIRMEQEGLARGECRRERGHYEVTVWDIWKQIEREMGISAEKGMEAEQRAEMEFCYANPYMLEVFRRLQDRGKKVIVISDMYLPGAFLQELLEKNGYSGLTGLYVSCDYGKSKHDGTLYGVVKENFSKSERMVHVGDHEHSDVKMGRQWGFDTRHYCNVNKNALLFRPYDMSPMVGGAYRGIVNNHIYCGLGEYSMEYEYGFIYGGLFVLGYCSFIHNYCEKNAVDKVLFLSRDGDILKQVYDELYPDADTEYVYWSRKAAVKLEAEYDKRDYFRRFLYHKLNQGYRIREVLHSMELDFLAEILEREAKDSQWEGDRVPGPGEELTDRNAGLLKRFLERNWSQVLKAYHGQSEAAKAYYGKVLEGIKRAAAVDIGWAGSGAMTLRHLVSGAWGIPCEVVGIVAGTNTVYNDAPEASESFLQSGQLVAYLYSQRHNRDLLKKHDPNKDYNVFWELLLSSPTPQFQGFCQRTSKMPGDACVGLVFGKYDANQDGIREIQRGILAFVKEYREHFRTVPYMFRISGRDAYAPMLVAASYKEKYLKAIEQRFALEIHVD